MPRKSDKGWKAYGSTVIRGTPNIKLDKAGRARDPGSGRFLNKRQISARKSKAKDVTIRIERSVMFRGDRTEYGFRAKLPKNASPEAKLKLVKEIHKAMSKAGVKTVKTKNKLARVKFFGFVEGDALDAKTKKRVRAGTGIGHSTNLSKAAKETESKIRALLEGSHLSNDPFKTTGSGAQTMKVGPDTIYMTAVYFPKAKVPGFDYKVKRSTKRK